MMTCYVNLCHAFSKEFEKIQKKKNEKKNMPPPQV